jgi:hypothetical protein
MLPNEKGHYSTIFDVRSFSAISAQKSVRNLDGIRNHSFHGLSWFPNVPLPLFTVGPGTPLIAQRKASMLRRFC